MTISFVISRKEVWVWWCCWFKCRVLWLLYSIKRFSMTVCCSIFFLLGLCDWIRFLLSYLSLFFRSLDNLGSLCCGCLTTTDFDSLVFLFLYSTTKIGKSGLHSSQVHKLLTSSLSSVKLSGLGLVEWFFSSVYTVMSPESDRTQRMSWTGLITMIRLNLFWKIDYQSVIVYF
jgi:hypothetical protein